jgi:hypothetical protein
MSAILIYTQYVQEIIIIVIMLTHARTHTHTHINTHTHMHTHYCKRKNEKKNIMVRLYAVKNTLKRYFLPIIALHTHQSLQP